MEPEQREQKTNVNKQNKKKKTKWVTVTSSGVGCRCSPHTCPHSPPVWRGEELHDNRWTEKIPEGWIY